jgi:spermidine synthase
MFRVLKPHVQLAEVDLPDGTRYSLHSHDGKFYLRYNGEDLMSTALTHSEQMLAEIGCRDLLPGSGSRSDHPRVLIGGLGMGFTLKRALELVGSPATVEVAELVPALIEWNRSFLVEHNGPLLEDPRTRIHLGDMYDCLKKGGGKPYHAILIDIDNTPDDLITSANARLYTPRFLETIMASLAPGGAVTYWLSEPVPRFQKLLRKVGFEVEETAAKPHEKSKRARHCIYRARRR